MEHIKPYAADGSKKEQVAQMFDNISGSYDGLNRFLSLGIDKIWRRNMVAQLVALAPHKILDMATGTADVALSLGKALPQSEVIGIDLSEGMLAVGRKKVAAANLAPRVQLLQGDSEQIQTDTATFDAATVAFGVRNFENLKRGLTELHRVLVPGGTLFVLEFSRPTAFPFKQLFNFYFRFILPWVGKLTSKDTRAYTYLYESVQAFPDGDNFTNILRECGFSSAHCRRFTLGVCSLYTARK